MTTVFCASLVFLVATSAVSDIAPFRAAAAVAGSDVSTDVTAKASPKSLRSSHREINHGAAAPSVLTSVAADRKQFAGELAANTTSRVTLRKCNVGERVVAWYKGDGKYYDAVIKSTSPSGLVTVAWYNNDPWHRTMDGSMLIPPCTTLDSSVESPLSMPRPFAPIPPMQPQAPPRSAPTGGVVYFLFMLNAGLAHADIWAKFFQGAEHRAWRALVHCQNEQACRDFEVIASGIHNMQNFEVIATTPTYYCHDLVTAMSHLLARALLHQPASHGVPEKYVFLSESTLPVKPFAEVHGQLLADHDSDFCIFPRSQWAYGNIEGHDAMMLKHHQWVVLSRPHAELFVREWKPVDAAGVWNVWLRGGHWAGKEHAVPPQMFYHPPQANTCADEWAFIATIYGAQEIPVTGASATKSFSGLGGGAISLDGAAAYTTQGRCRTFSFWDANEGTAFASLAGAIAQDPHSHITCYPNCHAHPASFDRLSPAALSAMRQSSFLFVRKFSPWAQIEGFEQIVLR